jgi:DNA polymerase III subunit delta
VAGIKPAYLICGEDDAKIDAWRARARARAEAEGGPGALEVFDARFADPAEVAAALAALTFATGTRYLLVDDADAWRASALGPLETSLTELPPDTVLVLVVRGKPLKQLVKAVEKAGGEVRDYAAPKPWELPKWTVERAHEERLELDSEVAKALVSVVGPRQQRLVRELEKLALAVYPRTHLTLGDVEELASGETAAQAYDLADALVAGELPAAVALAEELRAHDERPGRLVFPIARRLREVHRAARLLDAGILEQKVAQALNVPPWLAKKTIAKAKKADRAALERALCVLAELEVDLRGGGALREASGAAPRVDEDAAFSLALARAVA